MTKRLENDAKKLLEFKDAGLRFVEVVGTKFTDNQNGKLDPNRLLQNNHDAMIILEAQVIKKGKSETVPLVVSFKSLFNLAFEGAKKIAE